MQYFSSNSRIPNFELQSQCIWFMVNVVLIDMAGFHSGGLSDSTKY